MTTHTPADRATVSGAPVASPAAPTDRPPLRSRIAQMAAPSKIGGIYILIAMVILFSIWVPSTFPHWDTVRQIANNNAVVALAALALVIPLAAGAIDISVPYTMTLSGVLAAWAVVNSGFPVAVGVVIALSASLLIGVANGLIVVVAKIDPLIGTLASGFLIQAVVKWRTGSRQVAGPALSGGFQDIARRQLGFGLTLPVFYVILIALGLWYVLEHTATGRRIYATGFNRQATRLASVRTDRLRFAGLMTSSFLAGIAGVVLASTLGSGSPTAANNYLLPAFAAVFLGATQLKNGRFNAWGTLIAVVLLGTGTTGLGLANVGQWVQDTFTGVVLIGALGLTGLQVRNAGGGSLRRRFLRTRTAPWA